MVGTITEIKRPYGIERDLKNRELLRKYRETGEEQYRDEFFESNDKFSYHMANKYNNTGIEIDDIASAARIGMLKAFDTFDLDRDIRFATYAARCMDNQILQLIRSNKQNKDVVYLDTVINTTLDGDELTISNRAGAMYCDNIALSDEQNMVNLLIESIAGVLKPAELRIFENLMLLEERMTQKELSIEMSYSQAHISRTEKKIHKMARKIANDIDEGKRVSPSQFRHYQRNLL